MSDAQTPERHRRFEVVEGSSYPDWESMYRDNLVGIYRLVYRKVGNVPDAEDLAEEILVRTLRTLHLPAPVHEVRSYLVKTARTVLADHWRKHYAAQETVTDLEHVSAQVLVSGEAEPPAAQRAARILSLLPDRFRQILELRFLRGYTVSQAAEEMNVSQANAKVLQYRALRKAAEVARDLTE